MSQGYRVHAGRAASLGMEMLVGGAECLVHAVVSGVYERTVSEGVNSIHIALDRRPVVMEFDPGYVI